MPMYKMDVQGWHQNDKRMEKNRLASPNTRENNSRIRISTEETNSSSSHHNPSKNHEIQE